MSSETLAVGCKVKTVGLKKNPENNDREGIIKGFNEKKARYEVELPMRSKPFHLLRTNLEVLAAPAPKVPKATAERKRPRSSSPTCSSKKQRDSQSHDVSQAPSKVEVPKVSTAQASVAKAASGEPALAADLGKGAGRGKGSFGAAIQISKALSSILRHNAVKFGIAIRPDGFCDLDDVLGLSMMKKLQATQALVEQIVNSNEKKRFEMSSIDGLHVIRAVQGHSLKTVLDSELLTKMDLAGSLPDKCVHGTYAKYWTSILSKGLLVGGLGEKGERNHIHFAPFDYTDKRVISGMRASCEVAIYIDLRKAMKAGIAFFMSKNEVILTQGENGALPSKYFVSAVNIKTGEKLLPARS